MAVEVVELREELLALVGSELCERDLSRAVDGVAERGFYGARVLDGVRGGGFVTRAGERSCEEEKDRNDDRVATQHWRLPPERPAVVRRLLFGATPRF